MLLHFHCLGLAVTILLAFHGTAVAEAGLDASQIRLTDETTLNTLQDPVWQSSSSAFDDERQRLLQRLDRRNGKWDLNHPRWRLFEALRGFDNYREIAGAEIARFEDLYKYVPQKHKQILSSTVDYGKNFHEARTLIDINAKHCDEIVQNAMIFYNISRSELNEFVESKVGKADKALRTSISQALKHMVRDWSPEGHTEREATFPYILDALKTHLPTPNATDPTTYKVHVPGAGLGRLAHEVAALGPHISVTSNEFSSYMNLAYRWAASQHPSSPKTIHPFIETWSHARVRHELFRPITTPDGTAPTTPNSLNAPVLVEGDFTTIFANANHTGKYDAVVTLFFIDTARNLVQYIETIRELLKPGGVWINVGPLLYGSAPWVQLSLDEVVAVSEHMGFVFDEETNAEREVMYNFNQSSLYRNGYVAQYWTATKGEAKVEESEGGGGGWGWLW